MTRISRQAIVPYTPMQMYDLVDGIEHYPEFLPWCQNAEVIERAPTQVKARLLLMKNGIKKSFATFNRLEPGKLIEINLLEGPFKSLSGAWRFHALSETSSKVSLDLEFEFSSRLIALALGRLFTQITDAMVDAFTLRARKVYG